MGLTDFTTTSSTPPPSPTGPGAGFPPMPSSMGTLTGSGGGVPSILVDYNAKFAGAEPTAYRDQLIQQTLSVLISRSKPNALLVGPAGVGKTKIVEDIARRIADGDSLIPAQLRDHTVYELPLTALVSGTGVVGTLETKLSEIIDFASDPANKAIVFIDEIHQVSGTGSDPSTRKIAQILKPALARGEMSVIGATTTNESRCLDEDPAFARRFTRLIVDELTAEQTLEVLHTVRPLLTAHYQGRIQVTDAVLAEVVSIADVMSRAGQHRPDNALTLLDRAMADRVLEQQQLISQAEADGNAVLADALRTCGAVPLIAERVRNVAQRLLTGNSTAHQTDMDALENALRGQVLGQEEVIDTMMDSLRRHHVGVFTTKTPTVWMFAGASGVGKTETAKILSEHLTGTEPIVLNMAEYHTEAAAAKLIGAPPGYLGSDSMSELPFDTLESNPHRVILLDEFEKADRAVQRLFLSAFDAGYMQDSHGRKVDFSKAMVICTTNAARETLVKRSTPMGFSSTPQPVSAAELNRALTEFFDAELLGRFELVTAFSGIDREVFTRILEADYRAQRARIEVENPAMAAHLPESLPAQALQALSEKFIDTQGARPAKRAVRTWIEDTLLQALAQHSAGAGGTTL